MSEYVLLYAFHAMLCSVTDFGTGIHQVWSSATADGIGCGDTWNWCPSGLALQSQNFTTWQSGEPNSTGNKVCAYLEWNTPIKPPALLSYSCLGSMMTMCEVFLPFFIRFIARRTKRHQQDRLKFILQKSMAECTPNCPVKKCERDVSDLRHAKMFYERLNILSPAKYICCRWNGYRSKSVRCVEKRLRKSISVQQLNSECLKNINGLLMLLYYFHICQAHLLGGLL